MSSVIETPKIFAMGSSSDAYGERRDNEQAQACECRHGNTPTNWKF